MRRTVREFKVVIESFASQYHAGETVVIVEAREHCWLECVAVHVLGSGEVGDGARDAQVGVHDDVG